MELKGHSLDDILIDLYKALLATEGRNEGGSRGPSREILGVTLHIADPRSRLSRSEDRGKPFSALGELIWYLSGSNSLDFIEPYIPRYKDDAVEGALPGAYGPRMLAKNGSINQIENVTSLLRERPGSRRAVIQLFDAEDIAVHKSEIPCTTTIQFHLRGAILHMSVTMRSNDAYLGLPHDVFCFTMLQEMMARRLGAELGTYIHHAGSMHLYDINSEAIRMYIDEGYHRPNSMGRMPDGDPFQIVETLIEVEGKMRDGDEIEIEELALDPYWADIIRLLGGFWGSGYGERIDKLKAGLADPIYGTYLDTRRNMKLRDFRTKQSKSKFA